MTPRETRSAWETHAALARALRLDGFARLSPAAVADLVGPEVRHDWDTFAASWDDLSLDTFMGDGGRYRRRRHAGFTIAAGHVTREPHRPHVQRREHNALNGGIERWFGPVEPWVAAHPSLHALMTRAGQVFAVAAGVSYADARWQLEMHQFRIDASPGEEGRPTPEGLHRDGVDWVVILLVARHNVAGGETTIATAAGDPIARFTLEAPIEAVLLDDRRLKHGVAPITALDAGAAARRDVLVLTYRDHRAL